MRSNTLTRVSNNPGAVHSSREPRGVAQGDRPVSSTAPNEYGKAHARPSSFHIRESYRC